jgi:leader peptidase (prepilin peptidase) / N-methyltransferase
MFELLGAAYLAVFTIPLVVIDLKQRRLPNKITLPAIAVTLVGIALSGEWAKLGVGLLCAALLFGVGTALSIKGWLGMGDVKLLVSIGLLLGWFGWESLVIGLAVAFFVAGLFVLVRLAMQKITASSTIALGPFLLLGFWVAVIQPAWSSIAR